MGNLIQPTDPLKANKTLCNLSKLSFPKTFRAEDDRQHIKGSQTVADKKKFCMLNPTPGFKEEICFSGNKLAASSTKMHIFCSLVILKMLHLPRYYLFLQDLIAIPALHSTNLSSQTHFL